jgi:hypothetical protein
MACRRRVAAHFDLASEEHPGKWVNLKCHKPTLTQRLLIAVEKRPGMRSVVPAST